LPETEGLAVPRASVEKALMLLKQLGLLNAELKIHSENSDILIPLSREPFAWELEKIRYDLPGVKLCESEFVERQEKITKFADLLSDKLPPHLLASLPHAVDFIGDISVVEIPPELEPHRLFIGAAILKTHRRVKTVLSKLGPVNGVYRLRTYETIGGEARTQTVHKEHGCVFHVDLAKAYFSSRLSYEHLRVASLVKENETVVDMFAGTGPFAILTAKKHTHVRIYAVDMNPDAYELLRKNILVNRVTGKVTPMLGDIRQVVNENLEGVADRAIMNLPERAIEYVDVACRALKPEGGVIHYYQFVDTPEPLDIAKNQFAEALRQTDRHLLRVSEARIVRGIAPFKYQVVVDAEIK
jgi:tRNA (guanine37-N1)-methyltransferase